MKLIIHKANTRGHNNFGWLNTYHTFSFAQYYNPERLNFGALRVLNDDTVLPGKGFGRHPHDNMEIISIPLEGTILHRDSMNNEKLLKPGDVQVMSAGSGIFHEEHNASNSRDVSFLQIWIHPNKNNLTPGYEQKWFDAELAINNWQLLVSNQDNSSLVVCQDVNLSRVFLTENCEIEYDLMDSSFGSYLFLIYGEISIEDTLLQKRDGVGIFDTPNFNLKALKDSYILNIEVPI